MSEIALEAGKPKKVVNRRDADREFEVDVISGVVRLVHSRELAERQEGKTLQAGDRLTLRNLDGKPVFAVALEEFGDAVIDMTGVAFTTDLQPRSDDQQIATLRQIQSNDPEVIQLLEEIRDNTADEEA